MELNEQVKTLTSALLKLNDERTSLVARYERDIFKLAEENKKNAIIPALQSELESLKKKLRDSEESSKEMSDQLSIFQGASSIMDDLITQKMLMEDEYNKMKKENIRLKNDIETSDALIEELDDTGKITQKIMNEKEDNITMLQGTIENFKLALEEEKKNSRKVLESMSDLKKENKLFRDEVGKNKNINIDEIISSTVF